MLGMGATERPSRLCPARSGPLHCTALHALRCAVLFCVADPFHFSWPPPSFVSFIPFVFPPAAPHAVRGLAPGQSSAELSTVQCTPLAHCPARSRSPARARTVPIVPSCFCL